MPDTPKILEKRTFLLLFSCIFLLGAFLRLYQISSQILLDDEWHSLAFVVGKPFSEILTNFTVRYGMTSLPQNLYQWVLLNTIGWSEWLLRLQSLVPGLLVLIVGPLLAKRVIGDKSALLLALLLAISPLLIFYSRLCRPYSCVVFFSFLAVVCFSQWIKSGRTKHAVFFALGGIMAVYFHPFAAGTILVLGLSVLAYSILVGKRKLAMLDAYPSIKQVVITLLAMGIIGGVLMLPALEHSWDTALKQVAGKGTVRFDGYLKCGALFSGTANPLLATLLWLVAIFGAVDLYKRSAWFCMTLLAIFPMQILTLVLVKPHSSQVGIVIARYSIALLPIVLLFTAYGLQSLVGRIPRVGRFNSHAQYLLPTGFVLLLAFTGPLIGTYYSPNSFTNHGLFQQGYEPVDWSLSFESEFLKNRRRYKSKTVMRQDQVNGFYRDLVKMDSSRPIVEYPMRIGDYYSPLYFYQHVHRRPLLVGYCKELQVRKKLRQDGIFGTTLIDEPVNLTADQESVRYANIVDMEDFPRMRKRNVEFVIFHKRFEVQLSNVTNFTKEGGTRVLPPAALRVLRRYRSNFKRVHIDNFLEVFALDS